MKTDKKPIGRSIKKTGKPFLAARIPMGLNDALEAHSKSTNESKTDAIINALAMYLQWSDKGKVGNSASDRLSLLERRVKDLETEVYKPKQTNLLDIQSTETESKASVIKTENTTDKEGHKDKNRNTEWLSTKEAHQRYAPEMPYGTFRKLSPEKLLERFQLETDESKKTGNRYNAQWIKAK